MNIAVLDYNAGNVHSVLGAINRLGYQPELTRDEKIIRNADRVIFPGVGEASSTMRFLKKSGLDELIKSLQQPTLGICLGMQLMCKYTEENDTLGLNIFDVKIKRFETSDPGIKVPHMGWNQLKDTKGKLFTAALNKKHCYFVHSYYVPINKYTKATCDYIQPFSAAIKKDNFYATQFHPEKSGSVGAQILQNFINQK